MAPPQGDAGALDAAHDASPFADIAVETAVSPDAGAPPDDVGETLVADAGPPGTAVTGPRNQWLWVDEPDARCANGRPTGFGLNLADDQTRLVIFLQGGGACWDAASCNPVVPSSFYVATGYGRFEFNTDVLRPSMLPLRRFDPSNPFRNMSMVYVPYCTGDVHAGDRVAEYNGRPFHHVGARNLGLFLRRVTATFPRVRRVWLMGDSAGGFGAALNMDRVQRVFPNARVDVLDDSGQPIEPPAERWAQWRAAWNLQLPEGCDPRCASSIASITDLIRQRYPNNRFGLISYSHDAVISTFMGLNSLEFNRRLESFVTEMGRQWPSGRAFILPGLLHVGFLTPTPAMLRWINAMITDDPSWQTVN